MRGHFDGTLGAPLGLEPRLREAPRCRLLTSAWHAQIPSPPLSFCRCNYTGLESQLMSTQIGSARRKLGGFSDVTTGSCRHAASGVSVCFFETQIRALVVIIVAGPKSSPMPGGLSYHTTHSFLCVCAHIASSASQQSLAVSCKSCVPSLQQKP